MCGINGIFYPNASQNHDSHSLIQGMNAAIAHRGPNDKGIWSDQTAGIYLGHQRLSIIDLSDRGHQPMLTRRGHVIVYNGEAYNYQEMRRGLNDVQFNSSSDTE